MGTVHFQPRLLPELKDFLEHEVPYGWNDVHKSCTSYPLKATL